MAVVLARVTTFTIDGLDPCPVVVEADEAAPLVDDDADRVEADLGGGRPRGLIVEERARHLPDLPALSLIERVPDRIGAAGATRLHLHEHERPVIAYDEVDLTEAGAVVAGDEGVPEALEVLERALLPEAAEDMAGV